jgi:hypothetical protein
VLKGLVDGYSRVTMQNLRNTKKMTKIRNYLLVLIFCIGVQQNANASHVFGGELSWTNVGQDSFIVKLTAYSDCNAQNISSCVISFKCATTGASITSLNIAVTAPVDITPVCKTSCNRCQTPACSFPYGIHKFVMQGLVRLNSAGTCCSIYMKWEECCRSGAITTGASNANFYTEAYLNRCQGNITNSPQFSTDPVKLLCVGQDFTWQTNETSVAQDPRDSMTYEWGQPLSASGAIIGYTGQYDYNKPIYFWGFPNDGLPFPRGIHLDYVEGLLQFRPMKAEGTTMVVKINIFRNGVNIGQVRREINVIVIACTGNNPPTITTRNNVRSKNVCTGDTVSFDFSTNDPNTNDTLEIFGNNLPKGVVWTHTNGQLQHPTAKAFWKPTDKDARPDPYYFTVSVKDNACPINANTAQLYEFYVKLKIKGKVNITNLGCGRYRFNLDTAYSQKLYYTLKIAGKTVLLDTSQTYLFDTTGVYPYTLSVTLSSACNIIYDTGTIVTDTFLRVRLPADTSVYCGRSVNIKPLISYKNAPVKYSWSNGDTTQTINTGPILQNTGYIFTAEDQTGCRTSDAIKIAIKPKPPMLPADTFVCSGSAMLLRPNTTFHLGEVRYNWSSGDTTKTLQTGRYFIDSWIALTTLDSLGCSDYSHMNITAKTNYPLLPKDMMQCEGFSLDIIPDVSFTKGHVNYLWSTGDTTSKLRVKALAKDTLLSLGIEDSTGCLIQKSVFIGIQKNPEIELDAKKYFCNLSSASVTPQSKAFGSDNSITSVRWYLLGDTTVISYYNTLVATASGIYVFRIADVYGCSAADTVEVKILPKIDTSLSINGRTITVAPGMKLYVWYWNNQVIYSGAKNSYDAYMKGWYRVGLTDSADCVAHTRIVQMKLDGINYNPQTNAFDLYPNPTTGKLKLEINSTFAGDVILTVFNVYGKEILNKTFNSKDYQKAVELDLSDQPAGTYELLIRYQNRNFHQLIIKN